MLHFHEWAFVWLMLSLMFLAKPTVFVPNKMCFVATEQKLFYGQFLLSDSVERVLEPGA